MKKGMWLTQVHVRERVFGKWEKVSVDDVANEIPINTDARPSPKSATKRKSQQRIPSEASAESPLCHDSPDTEASSDHYRPS